MDDLNQKLSQLVAKACSYPSGSLQRRQTLNEIVRLVMKSGKIWKDNVPYYNDALQQTWLYFCRNICEANTGERYDPNKSSVITWLDKYLKHRLQDYRIAERNENLNAVPQRINEEGQTIDLIENIPAASDNPLRILENTIEWVESDLDGELSSLHIKGRPDVTCQVLIRRRLPPETPWERLGEEFNLSVSTLANFYKRQCMPRLRKFGESQGYL
ncbi:MULTISPECIES: sigma-70 family RNA polymerase sigma factor [Aerosakkonema]|uniref:sigma-70 family RNA polymerase sigma factor n=1 Tax=Aerosakkonema TaxID=1246629 RepID=UPI0035B96B43